MANPAAPGEGRRQLWQLRAASSDRFGRLVVRGTRVPRADGASWGPLWHDLSGESAVARDDDEVLVARADGEGLRIGLFENAQHVVHLRAVSRSWPPADDDPFADIGGGEPELEPVTHAAHRPAGQHLWVDGVCAVGRWHGRAVACTARRSRRSSAVRPPSATWFAAC